MSLDSSAIPAGFVEDFTHALPHKHMCLDAVDKEVQHWIDHVQCIVAQRFQQASLVFLLVASVKKKRG